MKSTYILAVLVLLMTFIVICVDETDAEETVDITVISPEDGTISIEGYAGDTFDGYAVYHVGIGKKITMVYRGTQYYASSWNGTNIVQKSVNEAELIASIDEVLSVNLTRCIYTDDYLFLYDRDGDHATITGFISISNTPEVLRIPSYATIDSETVPVKNIGWNVAHSRNTDADLEKIQAIYIPSTVEVIGMSAFYALNNLKTLIFEDQSHLKEIENYAFRGSGRDYVEPEPVDPQPEDMILVDLSADSEDEIPIGQDAVVRATVDGPMDGLEVYLLGPDGLVRTGDLPAVSTYDEAFAGFFEFTGVSTSDGGSSVTMRVKSSFYSSEYFTGGEGRYLMITGMLGDAMATYSTNVLRPAEAAAEAFAIDVDLSADSEDEIPIGQDAVVRATVDGPMDGLEVYLLGPDGLVRTGDLPAV
ncbi:MAG: leucine-rich repeat protein, partial [Candidatus Methanomethylophilaceae archaeon]|nr:leucine-rich repeat protein [Candidatus Methanomethylophilaceae archaeon]